MAIDRAVLIDHAGEMTERAYRAEEERDDANRALEMERAAHRVTVARQERFGAALTEVVTALTELPGEAGLRVALRVARQALGEGQRGEREA